MSETATKLNYVYDEKIKYNVVKTDKKIDSSKLQTYTIEGCKVGFNSLGQKKPPNGHSIQIFLPVDCSFIEQDKSKKADMVKAYSAKDPNVETVDGMIKYVNEETIKKSKGKITQDMFATPFMNFNITNKRLKDKDNDKFVKKAEEVEGKTVEVLYFANNDLLTGEAFNPEIFKYDENGEKVTTFISKKDGLEKPLYVNGDATVNITVRPYASKNSKTGKYSLKYNLLSIEIVDDGEYVGSSDYSIEVPDEDILSSVFGVVETAEPSKAKKAIASKVEDKDEEVIPTKKSTKKEVIEETAEEESSEEFDEALSELDDEMSLDSFGINLGD